MGNIFNLILIQPLFNLLALIVAIIPGHDFGIGIIIFTALSRLALWPLVKKQLHSQKTMQAIQPEMKKVKEKAKGDRQKEAAMIMELYKEKGVSPISSMTPLFLQLPIFIALFAVLRHFLHAGDIERLSYGFVKHMAAIKDIIAKGGSFKPTFLGVMDLTKSRNAVLALASGGAQYFQAKQLAPKNPDKQQAQMFKTTGIVLPAFSAFIAYTFPAALALYFTASSLVAIAQQKLVFSRDVEELEAGAETAKGKK